VCVLVGGDDVAFHVCAGREKQECVCVCVSVCAEIKRRKCVGMLDDDV
jgi:hypothetical protein